MYCSHSFKIHTYLRIRKDTADCARRCELPQIQTGPQLLLPAETGHHIWLPLRFSRSSLQDSEQEAQTCGQQVFSPTPILTVFTPKTLFPTLKVRGKSPKQCIYDQSKIILIFLDSNFGVFLVQKA